MSTCALPLLVLMVLMVPALAAHSHSGETEDHRASAGYLFLLRCLGGAGGSANVTWRRAGGGDSSLPPGVEVRGGVLWFLPVELLHSGSYTCERRDHMGSLSLSFSLSVSTHSCPDPSEVRFITNGSSGVLPCKQDDVFTLGDTAAVRWMKDCGPVQQVASVPLTERGDMRLLAVSQRDAGKYTCLVDVGVEERNYTAARSVQLTIDPVSAPVEPQVVLPQDDVVTVQRGGRAEVRCSAYVGTSEDSETLLFWMLAGSYSEDHQELNVSRKFVREGERVYYQSTLSISRVLPEFLDVPVTCHVQTLLGDAKGTAWLREADHSAFHLSASLCLLACGATLLSALLFFCFKVDLVLAYRELLPRFPKQHVPDGKQFDAYVSFLRPDGARSGESEHLALRLLPKELEERRGYSLFIRGRDDRPGEGVHDVISATLPQCRRLIIILSPLDVQSDEASPFCDHGNQLSYEQKVGLYDALTQGEPRVILLETGGPLDYSRLPESLSYIRRKHGALRWRSDRNFWKNLRYHMPAVPAGHLQTSA